MIKGVESSYYMNIVMSILLGLIFVGSILGIYFNVVNYGFIYEIETIINGVISKQVHDVKNDYIISMLLGWLFIGSLSNVFDFRQLKKEVEENEKK